MKERKFRVGDRVRFNNDDGPWIERQLDSYSEGIVVSEKGDFNDYHNYDSVNVQFKFFEDIAVEDLELVEPTDPKTAFLTELRELLIRHNASIYPNGCVVDGIGFKVGDEDIYYNMNYAFGDFINADNIMDFDKE